MEKKIKNTFKLLFGKKYPVIDFKVKEVKYDKDKSIYYIHPTKQMLDAYADYMREKHPILHHWENVVYKNFHNTLHKDMEKIATYLSIKTDVYLIR